MAVKTLPFGATPAELDKFRAEVSLLRKAASGCRGVCRLVEEPIEQDGQIYLVTCLFPLESVPAIPSFSSSKSKTGPLLCWLGR